MPKGEGGYKSKNKTADGKNKSWIGRKKSGGLGRKYLEGYESDGKGGTRKVAAKKKAAAKPTVSSRSKPKTAATTTSPRPKARPAAKATAKKTTVGSRSRKANRAAKSAPKVTRPKARPTPNKRTGGKKTKGIGEKIADKMNGNTRADRKKIAAKRQSAIKGVMSGSRTKGSRSRKKS